MMDPAYCPRPVRSSFIAAARPSMVLTAMSHRLYTWVVQGGTYTVVVARRRGAWSCEIGRSMYLGHDNAQNMLAPPIDMAHSFCCFPKQVSAGPYRSAGCIAKMPAKAACRSACL